MKTGSLVVRDADVVRARRNKKAAKPAARKAVVKKVTKKVPKSKPRKKVKPVAKKTAKKITKRVKKTTKSAASTAKAITQNELQHLKRQPLGHLLVEKLLREEGFRGGVSSDNQILDEYSTDESIYSIRPQIVIQPKDQRDIEIAVRVLGRETSRFPALSLTPRATGTGLSGGSLTDSIIIDMCTYMHRLGEFTAKKQSGTIEVEAGAAWSSVEKRLKTQGHQIAYGPTARSQCTIGGAIANSSYQQGASAYHHSEWIESLDVTLYDGNSYTLKPITYKEYKAITKRGNGLSLILEEILNLLVKHEKHVDKLHKHASGVGYALDRVLDGSVSGFKRGRGTLNLVPLFIGSQGTLGIITNATLKTTPISPNTELIMVPIFDTHEVGAILRKAHQYDPVSIELFDGFTFDLALKNPPFFRDQVRQLDYCQALLALYTLYHVRYLQKTPTLTLLVTLQPKKLKQTTTTTVLKALKKLSRGRARRVTSPGERAMWWHMSRSGFGLLKLHEANKRPAAFLEDVIIAPSKLARYVTDLKGLLKKYHLSGTIHGTGQGDHIYFYPLLDFTNKTSPKLIEKLGHDYLTLVEKHDGTLCGAHNDGIVHAGHLSVLHTPQTLSLFATLEHIFDPDDVFNPGKKANPRFDVKTSIRSQN